MSRRRPVRVTQQFFDRRDQLLPEERSSTGTPSTTDFLLHDMPTIIDTLATDFDSVTTVVPGVAGVRVMVTVGMLVDFIAVYAAVSADGGIELLYLDLERTS